MASKARHIADFLSDDSRGKDLGDVQVEIKTNKTRAITTERMGASKRDN